MSADILKEFLVAIGFKVDEAQYKKMTKGIADATKKVTEFALAVETAAVAVEAGVVKIASQFEGLYWVGQRLHATVANVQSLSFAFKNLGGTGDQAIGALRAIQDFITTNPAGEGVIHSLGVATKDSNGQLRDTADILKDLAARWRKMPFWQANVEATRLFGLDTEALRVLLRDTGKFGDAQAALAKKFGVNQDEAAAASTRFMQNFRTVQMAALLVFDKVLLKLQAPMESQLQKFLVWLEANGDEIADKAIKIGTEFINFLTTTGVLAGRLVKFLIALDKSTGGLSTKILELGLAFKFLGVGSLIEGLWALSKLIGSLGIVEAFTAGGEAVLAFVAALGLPVTIIVAIIAGLAALLLSSQKFRDELTPMFGDLVPQLRAALGGLGKAFSDLLTAIQPFGEWLGKTMGPGAIDIIRGGLHNLIDDLNIVADTIRIITDLLHGRWNDAWKDGNKLALDMAKQQAHKLLDPLGKSLDGSSYGGAPAQAAPGDARPSDFYKPPSLGSGANDNGTGSRSQRGNNPGNLTDGSGRIRSFGNAVAGASAMARQLTIDFNRHGQRTINSLINDPKHGWANQWSPGNSAASTANYIAYIAQKLGVRSNDQINLNDPSTLAKVMEAMSQFESGKRRPFDPRIFDEAARATLGGHLGPSDRNQYAGPTDVGDGARRVDIRQETTVHVHGSGDPHSAARETARAQRSVNDDLLRRAKKVVA